jgi:hypothetical protein
MDTGKDMDSRSPQSTNMYKYMSESNNKESRKATDTDTATGMGMGLCNPGLHSKKCTAILEPEGPGPTSESKFQSLLPKLTSLMIYKDGVLKLYCKNNFLPGIANAKKMG